MKKESILKLKKYIVTNLLLLIFIFLSSVAIILASISLSVSVKNKPNSDNAFTYIGSQKYQEYLYNEAYFEDIVVSLNNSGMTFYEVRNFLSQKDGVINPLYENVTWEELLLAFRSEELQYPENAALRNAYDTFWTHNTTQRQLFINFQLDGSIDFACDLRDLYS
ncbi:MAG: hypothetical protein LBQ40_06455 [Clostridiales bacterium]|jgi:hypothetical protein|nr:hypothetical protein [Clostridiales bacterium]